MTQTALSDINEIKIAHLQGIVKGVTYFSIHIRHKATL